MIGCTLNGGLGNMLFQIAALEDMGRRSGLKTCYPMLDCRLAHLINTASHSQNAFNYPEIFKNFNWYKNQDEDYEFQYTCNIPHKYILIEPKDSTIYSGYFQSERYFDRQETLKLFEPNDEIKEALKKYDFTNSCSVHIRRGDYVTRYSDTYEYLDSEYYLEAMKNIDVNKLYIFSDDVLMLNHWHSENDFYIPKEPDYIELFMMAQCTHNIIANSSFSWWGAYLNQNPDKKVIAPSKWYKSYRFSAMDIYTSNMTII